MSTIPPPAIEWLLSYLQNRGRFANGSTFSVTTYGLGYLTVKDLKYVWEAVAPFTKLCKPSSSANKATWVRTIHQCLNDASLVAQLPPQPRTATAPIPPVPSPAAAARHSPLAPYSVACQPAVASARLEPSPAHAPMARRPPVTYSCFGNVRSSPSTTPSASPAVWNFLLGRPPPPEPYGGLSFDSPPTLSPPPRKRIKQEYTHQSTCSETQPSTPQEWGMVSQLRQMGFTDMREMLTGIRHVTRPNQMESQVEDAMMWIVRQRENTDEARKIDLARASSEALRAEQIELRKRAATRRLLEASIDDWLDYTDLFPGSVVLLQARSRLESVLANGQVGAKQTLIDFLQLEKKARKWYGASIPWCYICNVCNQWKKLSSDTLIVEDIVKETKRLEQAMYSLSEQQGGLPKIFLEAQAEADNNGLPVSPDPRTDVTKDDEVVVLSTFDSISSRQSAKYDGDVIEIL